MIDQGAGRFGHRRRQVHAATDELTAFADAGGRFTQTCRLNRPSSPNRSLAARTPRRGTDQHLRHPSVTEAHPEADAIRQTEHTASAAFEAAQKARRRLDTTLYTELRPYGRIAHIPDPAEPLTTVTDQLTAVEHNLTTATTRSRPPQERAGHPRPPSRRLDTEHDHGPPTATPNGKPPPAKPRHAGGANIKPFAPGRPTRATPRSTTDRASDDDRGLRTSAMTIFGDAPAHGPAPLPTKFVRHA